MSSSDLRASTGRGVRGARGCSTKVGKVRRSIGRRRPRGGEDEDALPFVDDHQATEQEEQRRSRPVNVAEEQRTIGARRQRRQTRDRCDETPPPMGSTHRRQARGREDARRSAARRRGARPAIARGTGATRRPEASRERHPARARARRPPVACCRSPSRRRRSRRPAPGARPRGSAASCRCPPRLRRGSSSGYRRTPPGCGRRSLFLVAPADERQGERRPQRIRDPSGPDPDGEPRSVRQNNRGATLNSSLGSTPSSSTRRGFGMRRTHAGRRPGARCGVQRDNMLDPERLAPRLRRGSIVRSSRAARCDVRLRGAPCSEARRSTPEAHAGGSAPPDRTETTPGRVAAPPSSVRGRRRAL